MAWNGCQYISPPPRGLAYITTSPSDWSCDWNRMSRWCCTQARTTTPSTVVRNLFLVPNLKHIGHLLGMLRVDLHVTSSPCRMYPLEGSRGADVGTAGAESAVSDLAEALTPSFASCVTSCVQATTPCEHNSSSDGSENAACI